MKKIKNYGLTALHVEESFGYLKQVETETANLPGEEPAAALTAAITTFTTNVDAFDDALKAESICHQSCHRHGDRSRRCT